MSEITTQTIFVVHQMWYTDNELGTELRVSDDTMGEPVRAFTDYAKAVEHTRRLEYERRKLVNPFAPPGDSDYMDLPAPKLEQITSLDEGRLCDWIMDQGLEPPKGKGKKEKRDWEKWWNDHAKKWDEFTTAKVWEALDKVVFYAIVEMEPVTETPSVPKAKKSKK